jgi:ATP-binding cassette subfamily B protein
MIVLAPDAWPMIVAGVVAGLALPFAVQPLLRDLDLRAKTHSGTLARFFLDALLGLVPIRAHGAGPAMTRQHESLLVEWLRTSRRFASLQVAVEAIVFAACVAPLAAAIAGELLARPAQGGALLLVYWGLLLPQRAVAASQWLAQVPGFRNLMLRLAEPLAAASDPDAAARTPTPGPSGLAIALEGVTVSAGGHEILRDLDLAIASGEHLAVVGSSGAGKSSLLSTLLGFLKPSAGRVRIDDAELDPVRLAAVRRATAWVDPAVQLWSGSVMENLLFGADGSAADQGEVISSLTADELAALLPTLSQGMVPKMEACLRAVRGGVARAHVLDGRVPHALLLEVFTDSGIGTMVEP